MISKNSEKIMRSDLTNFFSSFSPENKGLTDRCFDLSVGNICHIEVVNDVLKDAIKSILKKTNLLTKYPGTQGYMPLNKKIAALIEMETGQNIDPEEIILTNGALDGIYELFYSLCNPGDYCFYCLPSFPYWSPADKAGIKSSVVVYKDPFDYSKTFGEIFQQKVKKNKHIKMILLNEPHNPIGRCLDNRQLKLIRDTCEDNGVQLVLDDVYRSFLKKSWVGKKFNFDNTIIIDSFSKRFGMPGLRLGFMRVPKPIVKYVRAAIANQVVGVNMFTTLIADKIAEIALETSFIKDVAKEIESRQIKINAPIKKLKTYGISSESPDGGIYRLLNIDSFSEATKIGSLQMYEGLKNSMIKVVPGEKLFIKTIDFTRVSKIIRLSVGGETRTEEAGTEILKTVERLYAKT